MSSFEKIAKSPSWTPLFHTAQTGMFPDVLSKLSMREEPRVSQPCVVSLVTWHVTSFFWVHVGKITGRSWNWLKVQLNLVEKFLSWPSRALAAFQAHDVHTSLMQPPALESCRAGEGEMSGNAASAATLGGTQLFPALPRSSLEFMTFSLSQCIPDFALPATGADGTWAAPNTSPLTSALLPLLSVPLPPLPLPNPMTEPWTAPKICQLEFLPSEIMGDGLWNGRGLLSVTSLSLLVCPLLIGGWTWANPTNSSAFLFLPFHLISLLLLCPLNPPPSLTSSPSQKSRLKPLYLNQFSYLQKQSSHQGYFLFQKEWRAWEEIMWQWEHAANSQLISFFISISTMGSWRTKAEEILVPLAVTYSIGPEHQRKRHSLHIQHSAVEFFPLGEFSCLNRKLHFYSAWNQQFHGSTWPDKPTLTYPGDYPPIPPLSYQGMPSMV